MIKVLFDKESEELLDSQSKTLNCVYNKLLTLCKEDYADGNKHEFLSKHNLRDYMVNTMKKEFPFLNTIFAHVLQEVPKRLLKAYTKAFHEHAGFPKYRSWQQKWFSLVYDDLRGWNIDNNTLELTLGKIDKEFISQQITIKSKHVHVKGELCEQVVLEDKEKFKQMHIIKKRNDFYAMFVIEKEEDSPVTLETIRETIPTDVKWIALDPNHKNFFAGIDYLGNTVQFENLDVIRYWDKVIDSIKSKRDKCIKKYKVCETEYGNKYTKHSPRWNRLDNALIKAYSIRDAQIKKALFVTAHFLYRKYDLVIIGDYTPNIDIANQKNMHRSMLNQTVIGKFRRTLEWVAIKEGKYYIMADEKDTTKKCCICGNMEKKNPNIREFTCPVCGKNILRAINSAVNIAEKTGYVPASLTNIDKLNKVKKITYRTNIA